MLHIHGTFVGSAVDKFDSKHHSLMLLTCRTMQYRLVELNIGKGPSTLAVFPVPADTSATPLNPLQPAQRPQPPCQAPRATSEDVQTLRTSSTALTASLLFVTSVAVCVSTSTYVGWCSYVAQCCTELMNSSVKSILVVKLGRDH